MAQDMNHYGYGVRNINQFTYDMGHNRNSKSAGALQMHSPKQNSRGNLSNQQIAWGSPKSPGKEVNGFDPDEDEKMFELNAFFNNDVAYQNVDCVLVRNKKKKISKYKRL